MDSKIMFVIIGTFKMLIKFWTLSPLFIADIFQGIQANPEFVLNSILANLEISNVENVGKCVYDTFEVVEFEN